ncbi:MAG: hypothetical protein NVSMB55_25660 [Mycobacteriales bacterium]
MVRPTGMSAAGGGVGGLGMREHGTPGGGRGRQRTVFRAGLALLATALVVSGADVLTIPAASASCTTPLAPVMRAATVNQGLGDYDRLTRGKQTLVRIYLSLPSCATGTDSVQLAGAGAVLTMTGPAGSTTYQPFSPVGGTQVAPYATAPLNDYVGDPKFLVPGADLAPALTTLSYTLSFSVSVTYIASSAPAVTQTVVLQPPTGTSLAATVDTRTNALRVLAVPMGDASLGYAAQFSTAAYAAVQNGMSAAARLLPVPDGATMDLRDPSLTGSKAGGIRYAIDPVLGVDLGPNGLGYMSGGNNFCMTGSDFEQIAPKLVTALAAWNAQNPGQTADRVIGVVDQAHALAPIPNGCNAGIALPTGDVLYSLAITAPSASGTGGSGAGTGSLFAQEFSHTVGLVPSSRDDGSMHSPSTVAYTSASTYRAYNVDNSVTYLDPMSTSTAARPAMKLIGQNWDDAHTLLEPLDYAFDRCILGGQVAGGCTTPATVGTASGVKAGPVLVLAGSTDGTPAGTAVTESYFTTDAALTPTASASPYYLVITTGATTRQIPVVVSFTSTDHSPGAQPGSRGTFRVTVSSDLGDALQLWKGVPNTTGAVLLFSRHRGAGAPAVTASSQSTDWQTRRTDPIPRFASAGAFLNGQYFVAGGLDAARNISSALDSYDPATDTWKVWTPPAPMMPVRDAAAVAVGGKIYVIGGAQSGQTDSDQATPTATIQVFDPASNAGVGGWTTSPAVLAHPRWGLGAAVVGTRIYALGGTDPAGAILSSVEVLDTAAAVPTWAAGVPLPIAKRELTSTVTLNGKIYVFGGTGTGLPQMHSVDVFDPATGLWDNTTTNLPQARSDALAGICNGNVYIAGGIRDPSETQPGLLATSYVERFDPAGGGGQGGYVNVPGQQLPSALEDAAAMGVTGDNSIIAIGVDAGGVGRSYLLPCMSTTQITATASTPTAPSAAQPIPASDLRADILLTCPGPASITTIYPLAAGLTPSALVTAQTASFSYGVDTARVCSGGQLSVQVNDGFQLSSPAAAGVVAPSSAAPLPAVNYPLADARFLQYDGIGLRGTALDPTDGGLPDTALSWSAPGLLSQPVHGATVNLTPPVDGWPAGDYTLTLTVQDSGGYTSSSSVPIHIDPDADHDGMGPSKDGVPGCGTSDHNPFDAFAISQNGIPNADDPDPCTRRTTPYVAQGHFYPPRLSVASSSDADADDDQGVHAALTVRYRDLTQVVATSVRISAVNGRDTSSDPGLTATGWRASSAAAVARFDRSQLLSYLQAAHITSGRVVLTIRGSASSWSFSGDVDFLIVNSPHDGDSDADDSQATTDN